LRRARTRFIKGPEEEAMLIDQDSAGIRVPPPLIFAGTLLLGLAIGRMVGRPGIPLADRLGHDIGIVALVLGAAIVLSALGLFRRAGTDAKPWKRSSALVTEGVYRRSRNPMYLGMALLYAGAALMLDSMATLLLLIPLVIVIDREVIDREEAYLEARFGERYRLYKAAVRRWL
jgi:protein-S-isoprenylcysteine O-methyltransferase Ste14